VGLENDFQKLDSGFKHRLIFHKLRGLYS